jgi:hypothetical protein
LVKIFDYIVGALDDGIALHEPGKRSEAIYDWPDLGVRHPIANC